MSITLQPELLAFAEDRARHEGLPDAAAYVNALVRRAQRTAPADDRRMTPGERAIERLRGTATRGLTADEIMAETRSEA